MQMVKMARGNIEALITRGDQLVKSLAEPIITEAKIQADHQLSAEINQFAGFASGKSKYSPKRN